jgi:hypothetical protein
MKVKLWNKKSCIAIFICKLIRCKGKRDKFYQILHSTPVKKLETLNIIEVYPCLQKPQNLE